MSKQSFLYRTFILLVTLLGGILATFFLYYLLLLVQTGFQADLVSQRMATMNSDPGLMRLFQALQSVCIFIVPPFIVSRFLQTKPSDFLSLKRPPFPSILVGILSIPVMIPIINALVLWNQGLHLPVFMHDIEAWMRASEDSASAVTEQLLSGTRVQDLIINLVLVALMAGLGEELLFRGLLQRMVGEALTRKKTTALPVSDKAVHLSIWLVAFLFSAIHLQFYGFFPRLLLGAWFGYLLWWTGSIWVPVCAHVMNNALSTLVVFGENKGLLNTDPDLWGTGETWWLCLVSALFLFGFGLWFRFRSGRRGH